MLETVRKQVFAIVDEYLTEKQLSIKNKELLELLKHPATFDHSKPAQYKPASPKNHGETAWQRQLYDGEEMWLDMELPIGQRQDPDTKRWGSRRLDLIGRRGDRYVLCELKHTKQAGIPFDALLQLLAYYGMVQQNAAWMDRCGIHHANARDARFTWQEVAVNPILMLRANAAYWDNWEKSTRKNQTARALLQYLGTQGVHIELYSDNDCIYANYRS